MRRVGDVEPLDEALVLLVREESALRLRLGQLLEVLGRGAVFDLGFPSLGAYAQERCERSVRWAEAARCLARRLEALPKLRHAVAFGQVSWSMGELVARVATAEDELRWLELAKPRTVRQVRVLVSDALAGQRRSVGAVAASSARASDADAADEATSDGADAAASDASLSDAAAVSAASEGDGLYSLESGVADELCVLTCTVDREDAWLFEATRCLLEQLGVDGAPAQSEALLAEAQGALLALPEGAIDWGSLQNVDRAQQNWLQLLRRYRDEVEASCEKNIVTQRGPLQEVASASTDRSGTVALEASQGIATLEAASCAALDRGVRALAAAWAGQELELSRLLLRFHRADGWRRLGYASETQYARERLGLSRSSVMARRALGMRLAALPRVAAALGAAHIGVEAAVQLVRIATPATEAAWLERARRRTIKHLREEVVAALTAVRLAGERDCPPPEEAELMAFHRLEQTVVSGRFALHPRGPAAQAASVAAQPSAARRRSFSEPVSGPRRAWCLMLGSLASWLEGGLQTSAAVPRATGTRACSLAGRVTLRLRMSREACAWWRMLEAQAARWLPRGTSWLRFACLSVWSAWRHLLGADVAYGHIYVRDRFRCMSPVCNRRDVTPHHIRFRSAGGSDDDENVGSVCTWCHLCGVHGGRIRAHGRADHIRWEFGPPGAPILVVDGRERLVT